MQWSDDIQIETPEQIEVSLEVAGLGSRFIARVLDWAIKIGIIALVGIPGLIVFSLLEGSVSNKNARIWLLTILIAVVYVFALGYDIYFELRHNGRTPGKKRTGIRVIRDGGAPLDFKSSCIRNLLSLADFLPGFYLLGGLLVLLTSRSQRLGDLAAGTLVIRERVVEAPVDIAEDFEHLCSSEFEFTTEHLAACSAQDRNIVRSFFRRYHELKPQPRDQLALHLASELVRKTGFSAQPNIVEGGRAEAFLASLYRDLDKVAQRGRRG